MATSGSVPYPGGSVTLDLIPFGGIERDGSIAWPPDEESVLRVTGRQWQDSVE